MGTDNSTQQTRANRQAEKDALFEKAKYGEITGEEADAEAVRLGLGRLSRRPGPDEFRPEALTHWTLPMVLAWIAYLDLDEVREWHSPFVEECWHWTWRRWQIGFDGPVHEGWLLEQRHKPTVALLKISAIVDEADEAKSMSVTVREAQDSLWSMLREGFLKATGIDTSTGRRVEIPPIEWHDLEPVQVHGEVDELHRRGLHYEHGYRDVLFPSAIVRRYWRIKEPSANRLPTLMPPTGHGYIPLFCAAQWIATEGGNRDFDGADRAIWKHAFDQLLGAIASDRVRVVGVRNGGREPVPGFNFAGIEVDYPFIDSPLELVAGAAVYLQSYPYVGEDDWRSYVHDSLVKDRIHIWTHLQVERGDIRDLWPFASSQPMVSGAPGRPTSMHLVMAELEQRAAVGEMSKSIVEETRYLSRWLAEHHADSPQAKPKSIEASIRSRYYELRGRK